MDAKKLIAVLLLVGGALALAYGGFSYTKDSTALQLGSIEVSVEETKRVNVPMWAGVAAMLIGGLLLVAGRGKS